MWYDVLFLVSGHAAGAGGEGVAGAVLGPVRVVGDPVHLLILYCTVLCCTVLYYIICTVHLLRVQTVKHARSLLATPGPLIQVLSEHP